MDCAQIQARLAKHLEGALHRAVAAAVRGHLDGCDHCWGAWNRLRWTRAEGTRLHRDLRDFLGDGFIPGLDSSRQLAQEWAAADPASEAEAARFYRNSVSYLYNLVIWEASGHRPRYAAQAAPWLTRQGARRILDFGCGIGTDVIQLRARGFTVTACDYHSPSVRFLQWRLRRSGQDGKVWEPHEPPLTPRPDTLWIIDTIDHLADIDRWLRPILTLVDLAVCENLRADRSHGRQGFHHRRPVSEITALFNRHGLAECDSSDQLMYWRRTETATTRPS